MELKIYNPTEDGFIKSIEWNHEEIKKEIAEKVEYYKNLVYTDNQIKEAKADRAALNKFVKVLEDKRKEVKKQCLAPYEDFEANMKEIIAVVNEPIALIDSQIKDHEKQKKQEKLDAITNFFNSSNHPEWLHISQIMNDKWLNASVSMKSIQEEIDSLCEQIEKDIATLSNLPEFGFEATEVYKSSLDINKALNECRRLAEIQKRKAEHEAEQARLKAEAEARPISPIGQAIASIERQAFERCINPPVEEKLDRMWVSFKAYMTTEDAMALKAFFENRQIEFKAI